MKKITKALLVLFVLGMATAFAAAAQNEFKATLSGDEIVPPVKTTAKGEADFKLSKDGKSLSYKLTVSDIENVGPAHIHAGKKGESGPPVAMLSKGPGKKGKFSGTLAQGKITAKDLMGSLKGKSIKDLIKVIESGDTYVNVHTKQNPDGEIRGQIK
jgi:CHRD domain